jgi:peptidoglycan/xylan/chitin deacetylase (PgdA/CDA1 family)
MKKSLSIGIFIGLIGIFTGPLFAQHTITNWPDNKKAAVSLTFDDGYPSHISMVVPAMNARDLKGTFFVITDYVDSYPGWPRWDSWREAAANGHEIGSHTIHHLDLTQLTPEALQQELEGSRLKIDSEIPAQKCLTFSYPYGAYNDAVQAAVKQYGYIAARTTNPGLNFQLVDFLVNANGDDANKTLSEISAWTDSTEANSAWQVVYIHSLDKENNPIEYGFWNQDLFQNYLDYLLTKNLHIATFADIVKFVKERDAARQFMTATKSSEGSMVVNVTDGLDDSIYNRPLTIRSVVPASWKRVSIQQNGSSDMLVPVVENGESVIYYQVVPDSGSVVLNKAASRITALDPVSKPAGGPAFTLKVKGENFVRGSIVRWNGSDRPTAFLSDKELHAQIGAQDIAVEKDIFITVVDPDYGISNIQLFTVAPAAPPAPNSMLSNPGFESGISPWVFVNNQIGSFDNDASGFQSAHAGHVKINRIGVFTSIYQDDIKLEPNTRYRLTFRAYNPKKRDVMVSLHKSNSILTSYGLMFHYFNLTSSWNKYSVQFTTPKSGKSLKDGRLVFWMGPYSTRGDQYFFDDIVLEKVAK